jgi:hypothetical protein
MENPAYWTKARNSILKGMIKAKEEMEAGAIGYSEQALIEMELLKEGFLTKEDDSWVAKKFS